ncbi:amidohydrolase 2 [Wilcoxina mikolae CBS 423.85]|nr:amidohydrolase 2 [Wilcoxina mikolae CBS 423.85]
MSTPIIVDIHTHVYPPSYISLLESRTTVPYIRTFPSSSTPRLIILPNEDSPSNPSTSHGRPIGPSYSSIPHKITFMNTHHITASILSLANPWLDFLPPSESPSAAQLINDDISSMCTAYPGRLFFFATLPVSAGTEACVAEVKRLKESGNKWVRGVVLGIGGMGAGLDDEKMDGVWKLLEEMGWTVFLHPHYGLPSGVYGPRQGEYGHVLSLSMGFPMETTIAVARMFLSGVFDRYTRLQFLLAHSGGTLPFLAGRLESCIVHDAHLKNLGKLEERRDIWDVLKTNILLDAVVYSGVGLRAAVEASGGDRVLFGTDHPFFPPLDREGEEEEKEWLSVTTNYKAISDAFDGDKEKSAAVLGGNAMRLLKLEVKA